MPSSANHALRPSGARNRGRCAAREALQRGDVQVVVVIVRDTTTCTGGRSSNAQAGRRSTGAGPRTSAGSRDRTNGVGQHVHAVELDQERRVADPRHRALPSGWRAARRRRSPRAAERSSAGENVDERMRARGSASRNHPDACGGPGSTLAKPSSRWWAGAPGPGPPTRAHPAASDTAMARTRGGANGSRAGSGERGSVGRGQRQHELGARRLRALQAERAPVRLHDRLRRRRARGRRPTASSRRTGRRCARRRGRRSRAPCRRR